MTRRERARLLLLLLAAAATGVHAADAVYTKNGLAIAGYDPVAYFTENRAVRGVEEYVHEWNGATWRFASAEHRDRFAAAPERFAPAYGGWCAYAMARGDTARIDPEAFTVHDGRLFLNYSKGIRKKWEADRDTFVAAADEKYPAAVGD